MRRFLALVLGVAVLALFSSLGNAESPSWVGLVVVQGNEPFTVAVLVDDNGRSWRLSGPLVEELRDRAQGLRVKVRGHSDGVDGIVVREWTEVGTEAKR